VWAFGVKMYMNTQFEAVFKHYNLPIERYTTRPTAFNTLLWSTTAETKDGYYYGVISLFDSKKPGPLYFIPKHHHLLEGFDDKRTQDLLFITKGYFTVEKQESGIMIHDLRYGFMGNPHQHGPLYVFSYQLWKDKNGNTQFDTIDPQRRTNTRALLGELWQRLKGI
jgi:inner membrane protein